MKTCKQCSHFTGGGDWNLCCDIKHPTPKEKEQGLDFSWGHLCYEDTEACDMFDRKEYKMCANAEMAIDILEFIKRNYEKHLDAGQAGVQKYIEALQMGIEALKERNED